MQEAAAASAGASGVMFLPHMSGAASPVVDGQSLGAFAGLTPRANARRYAASSDRRTRLPVAGHGAGARGGLDATLERIVAVGGATRNAFWMQNKADVLGRPIEIPDIDEATPLGAAILAGIGIGLYQDEEEAVHRIRTSTVTYQPDAQRAAQYARWFPIYRELYPATKHVSHQLFQEFTT